MSATNLDVPTATVGIVVVLLWTVAAYAKPVWPRIDRWADARIEAAIDWGLDYLDRDFNDHADQAMTVGNSANVDDKFAEIVERERAEGWSA